jgi:hypothetical protein
MLFPAEFQVGASEAMKKTHDDWRITWDVPLGDRDYVKFLDDCDCFPDGEERLGRRNVGVTSRTATNEH